MPQPRSTSRQTARKPAAKRATPAKGSTAAKRATPAKRATAAKRTTPAKRATTAKRTPAAKRPPAARRGGTGRGAPTRPDELIVAAVAAVRSSLTRGIVLSGERLQESFDDSVRRGRMTRDDAEDLAQSLIDIGRKQSQELLAELEALIVAPRVRNAARSASQRAIRNVGSTANRARRSPVGDRALREVDRARRVTGLATFPISGYDDLSVNQVLARLDGLGAPQLRKVRDYERRHGNRKSVINAIEQRLKR